MSNYDKCHPGGTCSHIERGWCNFTECVRDGCVAQRASYAVQQRDAMESALIWLDAVRDELEDSSDTKDGPDGQPEPNFAMRLLQDQELAMGFLRAALAKNPMPVVSSGTTEPSREDSGGGRHGAPIVDPRGLVSGNTLVFETQSTNALGTVCGTSLHQSCTKPDATKLDCHAARLAGGTGPICDMCNAGRYAECRWLQRHQVGRDVQPFDYEATVRAFHAWLDSRPAGFSGEDVVNPGGRWFDAFVAGARSQSVAGKKP